MATLFYLLRLADSDLISWEETAAAVLRMVEPTLGLLHHFLASSPDAVDALAAFLPGRDRICDSVLVGQEQASLGHPQTAVPSLRCESDEVSGGTVAVSPVREWQDQESGR